jgi:hypothetical protein
MCVCYFADPLAQHILAEVYVSRLAATVRHAIQKTLNTCWQFPLRHNGRTFTGRPGADQLSNHEDRSAGPIHCNAGLSGLSARRNSALKHSSQLPDIVSLQASAASF